MGMNKYSSQSFEEMAAEQEQNDNQEVKNTPAEPTTDANATTAVADETPEAKTVEAVADNTETPKTE